ncbi:MAG TPA: hypothetical protein VEA37_09640, partial [Flavobacterium sp.]|nr:hypothetical protein [Flavobacterium sp.]
DLNVYGKLNVLTPNIKLVNDAGKPANFRPFHSIRPSDNKTYFVGTEEITGTTYTILYSTSSTLTTNGTYTEKDKVAGTATNFTAEEFEDYLYWGRGGALRRFQLSTNGAAANSGATITGGVDLLKTHPGLGKLFYVHNTQKTIGYTSDGSSFTDTGLVVDVNDRIVSLDVYGQFVLVGVRNVNRAADSRILVWDGSATSVDDMMKMPTPNLLGFRIVGSTVRAVVGDDKSIEIYEGPIGGDLKPSYTKSNINSAGSLQMSDNALSVAGDILYFGFSPTASQAIDLGIYAYGSEQSNRPKRFNLDRLVHNGDTSNIQINSVVNNGSYMVVCWYDSTGDAYYINHSLRANSAMSANGVYQSEKIKLHPYKRDKIVTIKIPHESLPASTGYTVKVIHFGTEDPGSTPEAEETFAGATISQSQTTANSTYTLIQSNSFPEAEYAQIQIALDTVSGTSAPKIIFPLLIQTELPDGGKEIE